MLPAPGAAPARRQEYPQDYHDLAGKLEFTEQDLAQNRSGQLSAAQRQRLQRSRTANTALGSGIILAGLAFLAVVAAIYVPRLSGEPGGGSSVRPIVVAVIAALAVLLSLSMLRARRAMSRLVTGQVSRVEGPVRTRKHRIHGSVGGTSMPTGYRYEVHIAGMRFLVKSNAVLQAFQDGQSYRCYYAGAGRMAMLLSAERSGAPAGS